MATRGDQAWSERCDEFLGSPLLKIRSDLGIFLCTFYHASLYVKTTYVLFWRSAEYFKFEKENGGYFRAQSLGETEASFRFRRF